MTKNIIKKISLGLGSLALVFSLVVASKVQAIAPAWDVSGNYVVSMEYLGNPYLHDMSLAQDGLGNLTGNGGSPAGANVYTWVITSGSVSGNSIDFWANYTATADAVTPQTMLHVVGTIAGGTMSGTWSDNYQGGDRSGTWTSTSGVAIAKTNSTVIVSGDTASVENQPGWLFNRDVSTTTPYEFNNAQQSIGLGSLYVKPIGVNPSDKFVAENFVNAKIADINSISYDFMIGTGGLATQEEQFYMNVYANFGVSDDLKFYDCRYNVVPTIGSTGGFTTVTFDPTMAYPVTTRGGASASPYICPAIPADMNLLSPDSNIRMFSLNVGDTSASDVGLDGYLDNVIVNLDSSVTTFDFDPASITHMLTVALAGAGSGAVTSAPAGINCGTDCSEAYTQNTSVTLTATPATGSTFSGWSGACSGTSTCVLTMDAAKSATATFALNDVNTTPENKNACKNDGWKSFTNPEFKNQGQCVSYVSANSHAGKK